MISETLPLFFNRNKKVIQVVSTSLHKHDKTVKCSTLLNPDATLQMKKAKCAQCVNFSTEGQTGRLQLHMLPNR